MKMNRISSALASASRSLIVEIAKLTAAMIIAGGLLFVAAACIHFPSYAKALWEVNTLWPSISLVTKFGDITVGQIAEFGLALVTWIVVFGLFVLLPIVFFISMFRMAYEGINKLITFKKRTKVAA